MGDRRHCFGAGRWERALGARTAVAVFGQKPARLAHRHSQRATGAHWCRLIALFGQLSQRRPTMIGTAIDEEAPEDAARRYTPVHQQIVTDEQGRRVRRAQRRRASPSDTRVRSAFTARSPAASVPATTTRWARPKALRQRSFARRARPAPRRRAPMRAR